MNSESASGVSTELPSELIGRIPRRVQMTVTGWLNLSAAALFLLIGVALGTYIAENARQDITPTWPLLFPVGVAFYALLLVRGFPLQRRLARYGIAVRGCVTECHGPSRAGFVLNYTFENADNDEVEVGSCLSDRSRKVGSNVWVVYLPTDPRRSQIYPFDVEFFRIKT